MEKKYSIESQSKANGATAARRGFVYQFLRYYIRAMTNYFKIFVGKKPITLDENEKNMANLIAINDKEVLEKTWWDNNTICNINKTVAS